jgi:hypothetical protein
MVSGEGGRVRCFCCPVPKLKGARHSGWARLGVLGLLERTRDARICLCSVVVHEKEGENLVSYLLLG